MPPLVQPALAPGSLAGQEQPRLTCGDLSLRPWTRGDVPGIVGAYADPEVQRWHARTMTLAEAAVWADSWGRRWAAESGAGWAVTEGTTLLGRMGLNSVNLTEGVAAVAYWVVPEARGRGVARRALRTLSSWCLDDVGFHRLELEHAVDNPASCRVALAAGFEPEGTRRAGALHADGWHDMHQHGRLATDQTAVATTA